LTLATAEDVIELYSGLRAEGVLVWVDGGWGIDALLGSQTRLHKDFDALVAFEDLPALTHFLGARGFTLKLIWENNRWAPSLARIIHERFRRLARERARNFVLDAHWPGACGPSSAAL
jgi:Aminoglycoside-2''-adenylyltransferase